MKTYVISGASSGIGLAVKTKLLETDSKVINIDLHNGDICADLSIQDGRAYAIAKVHELCPDGIDGLLCSAGVGGACGDLRKMISLNYYGAVAVAQGVFDLLHKKNGFCVLVSSNSIGQGCYIKEFAQEMLQPDSEKTMLAASDDMDSSNLSIGNTIYSTSKYAVALWMRRHAVSWGARGVHLNCIAPGTTNTPMVNSMNERAFAALNALPVPVKFGNSLMLEAEEIADAIIFLLSPAARAVNGALLFADGGTDVVLNTEHVY